MEEITNIFAGIVLGILVSWILIEIAHYIDEL